jgi:hypothetical protein
MPHFPVSERQVTVVRVGGFEVTVDADEHGRVGIRLNAWNGMSSQENALGPAEARALGAVLVQAAAETELFRRALHEEWRKRGL